MNRNPQDITLRVHDWPAVGKHASFSLDARLFRDEDAVRAYCQRRFGEGALKRGVDSTYEYVRREIAAPLLGTLFTKLLNKSY